MAIQALSVVEEAASMIASGKKTLEIRRWIPGKLPLLDLAIVQNRRRLTLADPVDPDGRIVALVDVRRVRPWLPQEAEAACSEWEEGWLAWELENVRRVIDGPRVPAKLRIYHLEGLDETLRVTRMNDDTTLRSAEASDAEALADVYRDAVRSIGPQAYSVREVDAWARYPLDMEEFCDRMLRGRTIVAEVGGKIIGFGQLDPGDHLAFLYCRGEFSRRGIGSVIYDALERHARSRGVLAVSVEASRISRPFFEKRDFKLVEVQRATWCGVEFERFRMEKILAAPHEE